MTVLLLDRWRLLDSGTAFGIVGTNGGGLLSCATELGVGVPPGNNREKGERANLQEVASSAPD